MTTTDKDTWVTQCFNCHRKLGDFTIYVEDRDGTGFDGEASILATFVLCGPKCLKALAEGYGDQ